jgi:YVTN family beta-propeller protein
MNRAILRCITSCLLLCALPIFADEPAFHVASKEVLLGDSVKWDYLGYDAGSQHLFITRGDEVDIYDTRQGKVIGSIQDTQGVHGVAIAQELNKGFTSNGHSDSVTVFDLSTYKVLAILPTGKNPDSIVYDSFTRRVFAANGVSGTLTVIDAIKDEVIGTIDIGGKLEFAAVDGKGHYYINIENRNALVAVDTVKMVHLTQYDLSASCSEPTGLAIDTATGRMFVGCRNQKMLVVASATGAIMATAPIGKGCDAVAFDPELKLVFSSNGEGTLTIISTGNYAVKQILDTQPTARTMVLDVANHRIFTVAAEIEVPATENTRPKLKPGTFTLLTISR